MGVVTTSFVSGESRMSTGGVAYFVIGASKSTMDTWKMGETGRVEISGLHRFCKDLDTEELQKRLRTTVPHFCHSISSSRHGRIPRLR